MQMLLTHIKDTQPKVSKIHMLCYILKESTVNVNGSEMCKYKAINYKKDIQSDS